MTVHSIESVNAVAVGGAETNSLFQKSQSATAPGGFPGNSTFYKSETMVYNSSTGQYVPKWQIEDRSTAYRRTLYIHYYSAPKSIERVINVNVNFHYGHIHLAYLIDSNSNRLYDVLNNSNIYAYLAKIDRMAARTIMKQIEEWKTTEEDYIRAKKEADYASELGLLSNMTSRAEEMVFSSILCA